MVPRPSASARVFAAERIWFWVAVLGVGFVGLLYSFRVTQRRLRQARRAQERKEQKEEKKNRSRLRRGRR